MLIPCSNKPEIFFEIDDEDAEKVNEYKWNLWKDGYLMAYTGNHKNSLLHRFVLGLQIGDGKIVDHISGSRLDNRKCNLRICTQKENRYNSKKQRNSSSKFKGVQKTKYGNKWEAIIYHNNKNIHLGRFENEIDGAASYDAAAVLLFGEFAYLNFPDRLEEYSKYTELQYKYPVYSSKYRGVSFKKSNNKWQCSIRLDKKNVHIGYFSIEVEAAKKWDEYVIENNLDRELNFPDEVTK